MTILGIDISHWSQLAHNPVDLGAQGYDFLMWKCTQGSTYVDPTFSQNDTRYGKDVLHAAFHYMDDSSADSQLNNILTHVSPGYPVIVDMEQGSLVTAQNLVRGLLSAGHPSPFFYLPEWYWRSLGQPDVSHFPRLWASVRVPGAGYGSTLYQNVSVTNWHGYGNGNVGMLQYTQQGKVDGCVTPLDVSAFPGTRDDLLRMFQPSEIPPPPPPAVLKYRVLPGDTLWEIAFTTLGSATKWHDIAAANNLSNPNRLIPGQLLIIPGWDGILHNDTEAITYTVVRGDTLTDVAGLYGVSVQALYDANRNTIGGNPNRIRPGMVLRIPAIR